MPVELASAGRPRVGAQQAEARVQGGEALELLAVDRAGGVGRVLEQRHRPVVALAEEGAEDRHQRRDAAAAADQQDRTRARVRQPELAFGRREAEDHARLRRGRRGSWRPARRDAA